MDRELAMAVFERWEEGLPVYEGTLYKAAAVLGADPDLALMEARFLTLLDGSLMQKLATGESFEPWQLALFSAAAGSSLGSLEKTASEYLLNVDELVLRALHERNWSPDLEKLALVPMQGQPTQDPSTGMPAQAGAPQPPQAPGMGPQAPQAPQNPMAGPPDAGAQVQQQPEAREAFFPSPSAKNQMPPSQDGNMAALLEQAGQAQSAQAGGGLPPAGASTAPPPPPPPSPEEKVQQAAPDLPADSVQRYSQMVSQVEQQTGIPVNDPAQIQKIIQTGQKSDKKIIDQAIKGLQQQAQQQAAQAGMAMGGGTGTGVPAPQPGAEADAEKIAAIKTTAAWLAALDSR